MGFLGGVISLLVSITSNIRSAEAIPCWILATTLEKVLMGCTKRAKYPKKAISSPGVISPATTILPPNQRIKDKAPINMTSIMPERAALTWVPLIKALKWAWLRSLNLSYSSSSVAKERTILMLERAS